LGPLTQLADALSFEFTHVQLLGGDLRLLARPAPSRYGPGAPEPGR
jgi:hypothetical protein